MRKSKYPAVFLYQICYLLSLFWLWKFILISIFDKFRLHRRPHHDIKKRKTYNNKKYLVGGGVSQPLSAKNTPLGGGPASAVIRQRQAKTAPFDQGCHFLISFFIFNYSTFFRIEQICFSYYAISIKEYFEFFSLSIWSKLGNPAFDPLKLKMMIGRRAA